MSPHLPALWFALLLACFPLVARGGQVRHAVVVGANDGGGVLEPLRYAERDAEQVGEVLVELGDFDEELVTVLYGPTPETLRLALAEHAAIAEQYPEDLFFFYYSGHADAQGLRLGGDRAFYETLQHDIRAIDADIRLGILDACRSGAITRLKGATVTESILSRSTAAEGEAWLTASSADELAQESDQLRGGFFTHYLLSGLRGAADDDDGIVDLDELKVYTTDRVIARTSTTQGGIQTPHFDANLVSWGKVALTDLSRANAQVRFPAEVGGHLSVIRLPDRIQVAEASKAPGDPLALALPQGRYRVIRRQSGQLYEVGFSVNEGAIVDVRHWGAARPEPTLGRGERVEDYLVSSRTWERTHNVGARPAVAGGASLAIPGAGQLYNRQFAKGIGYFALTAGLMGSTFAGQSIDGLAPVIGAAVWGASIADAAYNVNRTERERPTNGLTLSGGGAFGGDLWPRHFGLSADLHIGRGFSFGLDRVGYTPIGNGGWDLSAGSRMMMAFHEGHRFRPAAFVALGYRHGQVPGDTTRLSRLAFGAGANLRYYPVPRYFTEVEARWEQTGEWSGVVTAVMFGVHIGR